MLLFRKHFVESTNEDRSVRSAFIALLYCHFYDEKLITIELLFMDM